MKTIRLKQYRMPILTVLFFLFSFLTIGNTETNAVDDVLFQPPDPKQGEELKLLITLLPSDQNIAKEVSIALTTWTDKNGDCRYTEGESVIHQQIQVEDNGPDDEEVLQNEILVYIFPLPKDKPPEKYPQKYTVHVTYDGATKEESIFVPSNGIGRGPFNPILARLCQIRYEISRRFKDAQSEMRHRSPEDLKTANNLYVYDRNEKRRHKIAHTDDAFYLTPTWSFDSQQIALVIKQGDESKIAWADIGQKELSVVTPGPNDTSPFWLPDNRHILFVRSRQLQVVDTETENQATEAVTEGIQIDQIFGVIKDYEDRLQVIYEGPEKDMNGEGEGETKEIYMLELDARFKSTGEVHHLVYNPIWHLVPATSPSREMIVYSAKDTDSGRYILLTSPLNEIKPEHLFVAEDEYNDYDPAWSADGNKIVFVSNRP